MGREEVVNFKSFDNTFLSSQVHNPCKLLTSAELSKNSHGRMLVSPDTTSLVCLHDQPIDASFIGIRKSLDRGRPEMLVARP